jgi:hypothetical protein
VVAKTQKDIIEGQEAEYRVVWEIDLYGKSPRNACRAGPGYAARSTV